MNIVLDKGLEYLKTELESRGYSVYGIEDNIVADAVLYAEKDRYPYYEVNNVMSAASGVSNNSNKAFGTLLINVNNKAIEEIINILNKRVYSPLF